MRNNKLSFSVSFLLIILLACFFQGFKTKWKKKVIFLYKNIGSKWNVLSYFKRIFPLTASTQAAKEKQNKMVFNGV